MANPEIDPVSITAPNALHKEMTLAAIAACKHVYCDKPLAPLAADALEMICAAEARGVKTQVGFNFFCNPTLQTAREMIRAGELGEICGCRGIHCKDCMADASGPYTFRHDPAGSGALSDIGRQALATAEFMCVQVTNVMGDCVTMISDRPDARGGRKAVMVDDVGRAVLRFANGASGSIEGNWIATGRKMQHDFKVCGTKGALAFSQEHFNVLHDLGTADRKGRQGFRRIEASPDHTPHGLFCVAAGHQIVFNDLKAIEVAGYVKAIAGRDRSRSTSGQGCGYKVCRDDPNLQPRRTLAGCRLNLRRPLVVLVRQNQEAIDAGLGASPLWAGLKQAFGC